jgi:iron complex outermembrane receptor protein
MRKLLLSLLILLPIISHTQNSILSGKVYDFENNSELIGVNITFEENQGTVSDYNGYYNCFLPSGEQIVKFQYIGYEDHHLSLSIKKDQNYSKDIYLKPSRTEMDLVVISAGRFEQKLEEVTVSMDVIKPDLIENKNTNELSSLMNQSPGVQVIDGQANIRGGSGWSYNTGSRVLVMVDDMPILSGDRGTVAWNMIPMENISQIEVIKGASSVLFGSSALNGVINVRTAYPKNKPETKVSIFSGYYDSPAREEIKWWNDNDVRRFQGMSFSYSEYKNNTGIVLGGNVYSNEGYKGGYVTNIEAENLGQEMAVSEKWGRFNFSADHNSYKYPGLSYGLNGNFVFSDRYQSLIFAHDSIGYTPVGILDGDDPVRFSQMMFNLDPKIKYINTNNNTSHSYKARFFRDDYLPSTQYGGTENEKGFSNVLFQEYQFQKTFSNEKLKIVSTTGLSSNYIKGDYESVYGEGGKSRIKRIFNYSGYSQLDLKYNKLNLSFGARLEHFIFDDDAEVIIPVLRTGINYKLAEGTYLRSSFGQGYRYPTIMELFVKTDYHPMYIYASPELEPEGGWSSEIGIKQMIKIGDWYGMFDIAGFVMQYDDMIEFTFGQWGEFDPIDPMSNLAGFGFKCLNVGKSRVKGAEVSVIGGGNIGKFDISLMTSYTYVNPVIMNPDEAYYSYLDLLGDTVNVTYNNASHDTIGNILKYRHEHLFKFDINLERSNLMTGLSIRYNSMMLNMDAVFGSSAFNASATGNDLTLLDLGILDSRERMLEGDLILDFRVGYHINENVSVSFIIDNLLNREYQIRPADLGPPRKFTFKLAAKI